MVLWLPGRFLRDPFRSAVFLELTCEGIFVRSRWHFANKRMTVVVANIARADVALAIDIVQAWLSGKQPMPTLRADLLFNCNDFVRQIVSRRIASLLPDHFACGLDRFLTIVRKV